MARRHAKARGMRIYAYVEKDDGRQCCVKCGITTGRNAENSLYWDDAFGPLCGLCYDDLFNADIEAADANPTPTPDHD